MAANGSGAALWQLRYQCENTGTRKEVKPSSPSMRNALGFRLLFRGPFLTRPSTGGHMLWLKRAGQGSGAASANLERSHHQMTSTHVYCSNSQRVLQFCTIHRYQMIHNDIIMISYPILRSLPTLCLSFLQTPSDPKRYEGWPSRHPVSTVKLGPSSSTLCDPTVSFLGTRSL